MNARMPYTAGYAPAFNLSNVADVQRAINVLRQSGFLHREAVLKPLADDGQMGAYTRAAITAFQEAADLPTTGRLNRTTRNMLAQVLGELGIHADANTPPATVGGAPMNIGSISDVQAALNLLRPGSVDRPDGVLGLKTRAALITFQKAYMLPATGDIDKPTRETIAQALVQMGIPAIASTAATGAAPVTTPVVDRSAQIRQQAVSALQELRGIGLPVVADSLRHLLSEPSIDNLRRAVAFLKLPTSGVFANQVAALWEPVLAAYSAQPDPDGALRASVPGQMTPLLTQVDTVLGAVTRLAETPTVDGLSATIAKLLGPQGGALGANIAKPLQTFLSTITVRA